MTNKLEETATEVRSEVCILGYRLDAGPVPNGGSLRAMRRRLRGSITTVIFVFLVTDVTKGVGGGGREVHLPGQRMEREVWFVGR